MSNIEEDIKKVKELNNLLKFFKTYGWIPAMSRELNTKETIEAIEYLLSDYTRQKQINEEYKKINGELKEENKLLLNSKVGIDLSYDDYIPKQKIKDKIEALRKMLKATMKGILQEYTPEEIIIKTNTLEELLQESEDK